MVSDEALEITDKIVNVYPIAPVICKNEIFIASKMFAVFEVNLYLVLFQLFRIERVAESIEITRLLFFVLGV